VAGGQNTPDAQLASRWAPGGAFSSTRLIRYPVDGAFFDATVD
jgi:hypothetical protein